MRLRQIALVAHDLDPVVEDLCAVFGLSVGFRDPGVGEFGLCNAVMPVGDTFLEVVSPTRKGTSAGRFLERQGGDAGYMVIVQSDDLDEDRIRLKDLGVRIVWELALEDIATLHLHPRDVGGAIVSLDVSDPPASWRWAGPEWKSHVRTGRIRTLAGVRLRAGDPQASCRRWADVLGRPQTAGAAEIGLDPGVVRFVADADGRGEGIEAVEVEVADREAVLASARERGLAHDGGRVVICGVEFALV